MSLPASWTSELTPTVRLVRFETMDVIRLCSELQKGIGPMFTCAEHGDYLRIRTPFLFPDGDCIDLFCKVDADVITASDLADTTGWLRMQSESTHRSPKQNRLIEEICMTHSVEFYRGMLRARCRSADELADVVIRVAQAALRVSDLVFLESNTNGRQGYTAAD